jgi:cation-dependent mannose-6-phosphate receptor
VLTWKRQQSSNLTIRGKRLILQYTNGSPCGSSSKRDIRSDDDDDDKKKKTEGSGKKSTIISFHCDKDPLASAPSISFVGVDPDECAYSFEVLSKDACIGSPPAAQGVGPGAVFAIIGVIAILVYFLGGVFYQRNVNHARGWRQLPNYSMWAGIGGFIKVSWFTCVQRAKQRVFPRIASVREGILPTMEVRPLMAPRKIHKGYMSRNSWDSTHLS